MSKPIFGRVFVVVSVNQHGPNVPQWGMAPGVFGNSLDVLYWTYIEIDVVDGKWKLSGWHFPTEYEAKRAADKARRQLKKHAEEFGWHPTLGLHRPAKEEPRS